MHFDVLFKINETRDDYVNGLINGQTATKAKEQKMRRTEKRNEMKHHARVRGSFSAKIVVIVRVRPSVLSLSLSPHCSLSPPPPPPPSD